MDFPQDVIDEVDQDEAETDAPPVGEERAQSIEESGEYEPAPKPEGKGVEIINSDQQAVMHRISEAIAMLVYNEKTNEPIIKMAKQGPEGVVHAVQMVMEKLRMSVKPGIPRELIPLAAVACLVIIQDFLFRLNPKDRIDMREVFPMLIDKLSQMFEVNRAESIAVRRIKSKFLRAHAQREEGGMIGREMPLPDEAEEPVEEPAA